MSVGQSSAPPECLSTPSRLRLPLILSRWHPWAMHQSGTWHPCAIGSACSVAEAGRSLVQAKPAPADRGSATVPLSATTGALFVLRTDRKRADYRYVSPSGGANLALLAATPVAAEVPVVEPIRSAPKTIFAPTSQGHPLDLPSRSESMRLKSRMREFCTSGSVGDPGR